MTWRDGSFIIAHIESGEPVRREGRVHPRGIALYQHHLDRWTVVHLNTGLAICYLMDVGAAKALEIATELAECGDWDFNSVQGWENLDPQLQDNVADIAAHYDPIVSFGNGMQASDEVVRGIKAARAN